MITFHISQSNIPFGHNMKHFSLDRQVWNSTFSIAGRFAVALYHASNIYHGWAYALYCVCLFFASMVEFSEKLGMAGFTGYLLKCSLVAIRGLLAL